MIARLALVLALLGTPALAQAPQEGPNRAAAEQPQQPATRETGGENPPPQAQQAPGLPAGDPSVQSAAPEIGAGRGAPNEPVPQTSEPQAPSGGERPSAPVATAPQAPAPAPRIDAPIPFTGRGGSPALDQELEAAARNGTISGRVTIPNQSAGLLIQPDGRDWRQFRNETLVTAGILAVVGTVVLLAAYHLLRGPIRLRSGRSGRSVQRFTFAERANHWMVATSFILLALTGLNITFGAVVVRPLVGPYAFASLTYWGQVLHHTVAFAFVVGLLLMAAFWIAQNIPNRRDLEYVKAGGPLGSRHVPTGKFNAGQKALFWLVLLGGGAVSVSGFVLMAPGLLDDVIGQQWAHIVHGLLAMGMTAVILGHAYIGSIGMEGAFEAMRDGEVDQNWAREHHDLWLDQKLAEARRTVAPPGTTPNTTPAPAE